MYICIRKMYKKTRAREKEGRKAWQKTEIRAGPFLMPSFVVCGERERESERKQENEALQTQENYGVWYVREKTLTEGTG